MPVGDGAGWPRCLLRREAAHDVRCAARPGRRFGESRPGRPASHGRGGGSTGHRQDVRGQRTARHGAGGRLARPGARRRRPARAPGGAPVLRATDPALVHDHAPSLAGSRWSAVNACGPGPDRPALGPEEAARGLAGLDVADLRAFLGTAGAAPGIDSPPVAPVAVAVTDEHWRHLLDDAVRAAQATAWE